MVNEMQKPQKPPLNPLRIVGESLAGAIGAIIGLAPLLSLLYQEAMHGPSEWGFGNLLALPLTYPFGSLISAVGVYLVGNARNETGSVGLTLGSCAVGVAVAFAIGVQAIAGEWGIDNRVLFVIFFAAPTLGAIVGFNLTRMYKSPPT
jgi:hypothetical protein